ncbi:unnamed protein product [Phytophthora lilii]|uniref:Unnamed protein product n=1 Tax=Phytophthora lilii TaxID=2077276 RepID=A0A9W6TKC8_9STRA|nr:unnamed protein product [Phytophthora lilii]
MVTTSILVITSNDISYETILMLRIQINEKLDTWTPTNIMDLELISSLLIKRKLDTKAGHTWTPTWTPTYSSTSSSN